MKNKAQSYSTRLISTGFALSFAGALPPGVVALGVLQATLAGGWWGGWMFSLGSLSVEAAFVWLTLVGMAWLTRRRRWLRRLDWATLFLLAGLAIGAGWQLFFRPAGAAAAVPILLPPGLPFFAAGGLLRLLTPTLLPFWMACNAVLFSKKLLSPATPRRHFGAYTIGVAGGTFAAHSVFVALSQVASAVLTDLQTGVNWLIFFGLSAASVGQAGKLFFKN